jgi:type II secretory pathway component PulF
MKKQMNNKELSQFYYDLSVIANSGLTVEQGLITMKHGKKGTTLWMIDGMQYHISRGGTLWEGMAQYPKFFDDFQVMIIKGAEVSGTLPETCKGLSRYFEMRHKEKKRLLAGLIYPVILLHAAVLLPPLKYLVVDNLEQSYWSKVLPSLLIAYGIVGILYFTWKKFCRTGKRRERIDEIILKLPLIGKLARGTALVRVLRTLANLNNAGIEPVRAARTAAQTAGNAAVTRDLSGALPVLEHGGTFADFFSFSGVLPSSQLGVVSVGEQTGTLVESLERMVVQMEETNSQRLTSTIKTLGYAAYLIAAVVVALTVISFYSSYFRLV